MRRLIQRTIQNLGTASCEHEPDRRTIQNLGTASCEHEPDRRQGLRSARIECWTRMQTYRMV